MLFDHVRSLLNCGFHEQQYFSMLIVDTSFKGNAEKPNNLKYLAVNVINDNKVCLAKTKWMDFELMANMMCAGYLEGI